MAVVMVAAETVEGCRGGKVPPLAFSSFRISRTLMDGAGASAFVVARGEEAPGSHVRGGGGFVMGATVGAAAAVDVAGGLAAAGSFSNVGRVHVISSVSGFQ